MLNFYNIEKPYRAIIYANNEEEALEIYEAEVCERDEFTKCEQTSLGDVFAFMMLMGTTVDGIRSDISDGKVKILAVDKALY